MTGVAVSGKVACMNVAQGSTGWNQVYSLWHIPSSTLLVTTLLREVVARRVRCALMDGCLMDDLMLQVTGEGELIGAQHLGDNIVAVLQMGDESCLEDAEAS